MSAADSTTNAPNAREKATRHAEDERTQPKTPTTTSSSRRRVDVPAEPPARAPSPLRRTRATACSHPYATSPTPNRSLAITGINATAPPNRTAKRSRAIAASSTGVRRIKMKAFDRGPQGRPVVRVGRQRLTHEGLRRQHQRAYEDQGCRAEIGHPRIHRVQESADRRADDDGTGPHAE